MKRPLKLAIAGLFCALLPFVVFVGTTYEHRVNGAVVVSDQQNFAGYAGGLAALAIAVVIIARPKTPADREPKWRATGAAIGALGVLQLAYSAGVFG